MPWRQTLISKARCQVRPEGFTQTLAHPPLLEPKDLHLLFVSPCTTDFLPNQAYFKQRGPWTCSLEREMIGKAVGNGTKCLGREQNTDRSPVSHKPIASPLLHEASQLSSSPVSAEPAMLSPLAIRKWHRKHVWLFPLSSMPSKAITQHPSKNGSQQSMDFWSETHFKD